MAFLKTILALARISSLPTVWSNCLAGWWLGGGRHIDDLPFIFAGATFLYMGGSFLKDAFDVDFDRQYRPERPIPSGTFSQNTVYRVGLTFLTIGALVLVWPGHFTSALGLLLVFVIVVHNTTHRLIPVAPLLKGICRLLLYLLGASVAARGIGGWVIWCGLALALYTAGVGYLASSSLNSPPSRRWPILLLAGPIALSLVMNAGGTGSPACCYRRWWAFGPCVPCGTCFGRDPRNRIAASPL